MIARTDTSTRAGGLLLERQATRPVDLVSRLTVLVAAAACITGVIAVAQSLRDTGSNGAAASASATSVPNVPRAGERAVATSFGMLGVHEPRLTRGVGAKALAGQTHGINDHVPPERQLVQVPVTLFNASDEPTAYDAARFRLVLRARGSKRDTGSAKLASSRLRSGTLASGASIDADLAFVIPRTGADLYLLFRDRDQVLRVPIGDAGAVYRPQTGDHARHETGHAHPTGSPRP